MATLAEIRAKLQAQENRNSGNNNSNNEPNALYPHWNIEDNETARLRFLPDADPTNTFFWVERLLINLKFAGIKGEANSKPVTVQIPCMEMWGEQCPILAEVRPWYKDESLKEIANQYWKKRSYFFQGFVRDNPLKDDKTPENPIRRFVISPQIFTLVKSALLDPEMEELPTDYAAGLDFLVSKTSKGGFADYSTSKWARKESALTAEEAAAIEKFGLYDLKSFLPKKPDAEAIAIMKEMFEASVDGQPYDAEKWGNYFKPRGSYRDGESSGSSIAPSTAPAATKSTVQSPVESAPADSVPFDEDEAPAPTAPVVTPQANSSARAEDILAMIRNRNKSA